MDMKSAAHLLCALLLASFASIVSANEPAAATPDGAFRAHGVATVVVSASSNGKPGT